MRAVERVGVWFLCGVVLAGLPPLLSFAFSSSEMTIQVVAARGDFLVFSAPVLGGSMADLLRQPPEYVQFGTRTLLSLCAFVLFASSLVLIAVGAGSSPLLTQADVASVGFTIAISSIVLATVLETVAANGRCA